MLTKKIDNYRLQITVRKILTLKLRFTFLCIKKYLHSIFDKLLPPWFQIENILYHFLHKNGIDVDSFDADAAAVALAGL